ncbi:nuclear transport factor 2 family protein [Sphingomonas sp. SUN019]|uniref:nuclear transport factor 2 family protein n=1 Tax=Sphingomonas sp. SUN019 TaxID=2937788 RepID=UPI0021646877|nr:nuclear transport factor 2 family protein [Sphingomonas sp. SUN019]UVO50727.1 nuclear transport factor 2 family protein [Sphingomonas sp. SUN019]
MQYPPTLSRDALVDLAINRYFAHVDAKDMATVLDCFNDEALLTTQTSFTTHAGKPAIERMFADLFGAWETLVHKDFTITVDEMNGRIAASFEAVLTDADGGVTHLFNTNFWRVRDGRFQEVHVYMSGANVLV